MTEKISSLKFVLPKTDALDVDEACRRAQTILSRIIDENKVQEEAREMLAEISLQKSKRKRKAAPEQEHVLEHDYSDEMAHTLKDLLTNSYRRSNSFEMENRLSSEPACFKKMIEALDLKEFELDKLFNPVKNLLILTSNVIMNILILVSMNWIGFQDIIDILTNTAFEEIGFYVMKHGDDETYEKFTEFLVSDSRYKSKLISVTVKTLVDPPSMGARPNEKLKISANDLIPALLHQEYTYSVDHHYSGLLELHKEVAFQNQVQRLTELLSDVPCEQIFGVLKTTCGICNVNPRFFSVAWCLLIEKDDGLTATLEFLSEFLKETLSKQHRHNLILSIVLMRILDLVGSRTYIESYQLYFGNGSTYITSSKSVEFILDTLTSLVPQETGVFLKHHIQLPLRGGGKFKDKLDQYIMLAKTRMKDFTLFEIDKNIVHDVGKAINLFKKKGSIPSFVIEASIFKKQYYINHFLPCLLKNNSVEDEEGRQNLVNALTAANKIPKSVTSISEPEVQEISPAANLLSIIESLPLRGRDVKDTLYRMCCSTCDETTLMLLIRTVCFECPAVEPVVFLKEFACLHQLRGLFSDCVEKLICENKGVSKVIPLLELFDYETSSKMMKAMILKDRLLYKSISGPLEIEFLHIVVLGKVTANPDFSLPDAVCKHISVEKLCETLSWWPYSLDKIYDFQMTVSRILDKVSSLQPSNDVCITLFKSCLTLNVLPFVTSSFLTLIPIVTFTKLWVYEALAQVLLPLYQGSLEKPVSKIQEIFRRFFNLINVIKPSLLYRCGTSRSVQNLLSVLDSYKIYITTESYLLAYPIALTIVRSVHDANFFNILCEKSPTFLISCVYYFEDLAKVRGSDQVKTNPLIIAIIDFLKKLENGGISSNDMPDEDTSPVIGVCWFLVYAEKHVSEFGRIAFNSSIAEGYLTTMFYSYSSLWLSGSLKERHLTSLGELAIRSTHYHQTYTSPLLKQGSPSSAALTQHFSGYKTSTVFHLLYLGGLASCCLVSFDKSSREDVMLLARKAYQQAQRLVYDNISTMQSMQGFMVSLIRSGDQRALVHAAREFITCLCRCFTLTGT